MSSRVLKKLRGNDLELQQSNDETSDNEDNDVEEQEDESIKNEDEKNQNQNIFELLSQQSLSDSETKEDSTEIDQNITLSNDATNAAKKKKRKNKSKAKATAVKSKEDEHANKHVTTKDSLLNKVNEVTKHTTKSSSSSSKDVKNESLLTVELKHLNPQNELRRTFGKRVIRMDSKRTRPKVTLKTTYIVSAKETWPPVTKNIITMKLTTPPEAQLASSSQSVLTNCSNGNDVNNKLHWFEFEHSPYYQNIQSMFLSALERTDSDLLINLTWRCPHHVDSLIQLSEICKMTEDYFLAAELIERAVFVLESSLHPNFSLTTGNCRLDYKRQRNRAFFIALFKHAQYLEARACCRTAFEISKLLLSLNPETDPLAMVLVLDYYALRSKQYKWLIDFYEKYNATRNLSQLPNMAYSYALALFCYEGESEASDTALQYALLMFPGVIKPLLDELSVQTDKRILTNSYFNSEISNNQAPALHQLVCLYICRAKNIWRQNNILPWLERNVNGALDRVESNDEIIQEYRLKRSSRYLQPPRPVLRHVILADFKEKVPLAPFVAKELDAIMIYDPLPPIDSIDFYERKPSTSTSTQTQSGLVSGFFRSLLPSFSAASSIRQHQQQPPEQQQEQLDHEQQQNLPAIDRRDQGNEHFVQENDNNALDGNNEAVNALEDNNVENVNDEEQTNQMPNEVGATYRELTHSLSIVVEAMRSFLHNVRITEYDPPGGDGNNSDDNDNANNHVE